MSEELKYVISNVYSNAVNYIMLKLKLKLAVRLGSVYI